MDSLFSTKEEPVIKPDTLDQRHWVVLFIAGVSLSAIFFAFGLYVGRWTAEDGGLSRSAFSRSLLPQNGQADGPAMTTDSTAEKAAPAVSPLEGLPGSSNLNPAEGLPDPNSNNPTAADASASPPSTPPEESSTREGFSVRVGQFGESKEADSLAEMLRSRGFVSATVEPLQSENGNPKFQVLLGPWVDRDSAVRTMNELRNQGVTDVSIISKP